MIASSLVRAAHGDAWQVEGSLRKPFGCGAVTVPGAAAGAHVAHLHPDTDEAARVYGRLGFVEVAGFDVYVDL